MARIIKSVSLDPRTAHIAGQMGNFSAFVRVCLMQYENHFSEVIEHTHEEANRHGGLCNAMARPYCRACYPHGPPSGEAWRAGRADPQVIGADWLLAQAVKDNDHEWHLVAENVAYSAPRPVVVPDRRGLLDRLLRR